MNKVKSLLRKAALSGGTELVVHSNQKSPNGKWVITYERWIHEPLVLFEGWCMRILWCCVDKRCSDEMLMWKCYMKVWYEYFTWNFDINIWHESLTSNLYVKVWRQYATWKFDVKCWHERFKSIFDMNLWCEIIISNVDASFLTSHIGWTIQDVMTLQ